MPIVDLCSKNLVCVDSSSTLQYAAKLMKRHNVGGVVVVVSKKVKTPLGILTDRDIALSVAVSHLPLDTKVTEVMTKNPVTADRGEGVSAVIDKMEQAQVRRVILTDAHGEACALVSSDDILQLISREINGIGNLIKAQIEDEAAHRKNQKRISML
jgi:CBS domain-containing protein